MKGTLLVVVLIAASCRSPEGAAPPSTPIPSNARPTAQAPSASPTERARLGVTAMRFVDAAHGWIAREGAILGTADGGRTWTTAEEPTGAVRAIDAIDATHAWAATDTGLVATTDGRRWAKVADGAFAAVRFVDASHGWAILGPNAVAASTSDGGRTWVPQRTTGVRAVCFTDARTGWLQTDAAVLRTVDAGASWSLSLSVSLRGATPSHAVALGCAGTAAYALFVGQGAALSHVPYVVYATADAAHWRVSAYEHYTSPVVADAPDGPGVHVGALSVVDARTAYLFGWYPEQSTFARTTDGGRTWANGALGTGIVYEASAGEFVDASHGWAVLHGVVYATADAGATWERRTP